MEPVSQNWMIDCYHCDRVWVGRQKDILVPQPEMHHHPAFSSIFPDLFFSFPFLSQAIFFLFFQLKNNPLKKNYLNRSTLFLCFNTYTKLAFSRIAVSELKVDNPPGQTTGP